MGCDSRRAVDRGLVGRVGRGDGLLSNWRGEGSQMVCINADGGSSDLPREGNLIPNKRGW